MLKQSWRKNLVILGNFIVFQLYNNYFDILQPDNFAIANNYSHASQRALITFLRVTLPMLQMKTELRTVNQPLYIFVLYHSCWITWHLKSITHFFFVSKKLNCHLEYICLRVNIHLPLKSGADGASMLSILHRGPPPWPPRCLSYLNDNHLKR